MDVRERIEPLAAPRCPYCHDLLEGEQRDDALVVCGGCGTRHHGACLDELGRCTVLGCTWTPPGGVGLGRFNGARSVEELRRSVRERARRFVREHTRPSPWRWRPSDPQPLRLAGRAERWESDTPSLERRLALVIFGLVIAVGVLALIVLVIAGLQGAIFGK